MAQPAPDMFLALVAKCHCSANDVLTFNTHTHPSHLFTHRIFWKLNIFERLACKIPSISGSIRGPQTTGTVVPCGGTLTQGASRQFGGPRSFQSHGGRGGDYWNVFYADENDCASTFPEASLSGELAWNFDSAFVPAFLAVCFSRGPGDSKFPTVVWNLKKSASQLYCSLPHILHDKQPA